MKAILKISPAIEFEGKKVSEIDLSEMEGWTSKKYNSVVGKMKASGFFPDGAIENSQELAWFIGNELSGLPIEFFQQLPVKYIKAIALVVVRNFSLTADILNDVLEIKGLTDSEA